MAAVENPITERSLTGITTNVLIPESTYTNAPHVTGQYFFFVCVVTPWRITSDPCSQSCVIAEVERWRICFCAACV